MKFLVFAASKRRDSFNKKLIKLVAQLLQQSKHDVDVADFNEFDMPLYDGDMEASQGLPAAAHAFIQRLHAADGLIISSPEYNFSTPGTLKNLIDWVSRHKPMPWTNQRILLLSASPALVGGNRGLWQTRIPLEACGAFVFPDMFSLAAAHQAFDDQAQLKDAGLQQRLASVVDAFTSFVGKMK